MMSINLRRAIRLTLVTAGSLAGALSAAGSAAQDSAGAESLQEIVVTGSRIARPELESSTPVQILDTNALADRAALNIADVVGDLPSVGTPAISRTNSNFLTSGNGISTVNLRNLGDQRTLVLVNGRRVVAGVGGTSIVDLNNIPSDLIERVEVMTGGASAVYGSEAIAGVVNFRLKSDFEGISLRAQGGQTTESDNLRYLGSLTAGHNFGDRGNVTVNVQYDKDDGLRSRDREISAEDVPFRSSFVPQGRFQYGSTVWTFNPSNQLQRGFNTAVDGFNRNGERYISVPVERTLGTVLGHYQVTDFARVFFEGSYGKVESNSSLEPLATDNSDASLPDGSPYAGLTLDNPFIPAAIRTDMVATGATILQFRKRMNGVFDRSNRNERDYYRVVAGFDGEVFESGWNYEVYYNQGQTKEDTRSESGYRDRYFFALDAIAGPGGTPICRDAAARAAGCQPFNPFGFNSVSAASAAYVTGGLFDTYDAKVEQRVVAANVTGTLFEAPGGDAKLALGLERRSERSEEKYSEASRAGNNFGNALSDTSGRYSVWEAYGESVVPLISGRTGIDYLGVEAAARYGDYSTVGDVFSWKFGVEYAPIEDVRMRAVFSRATRAPNIAELYAGLSQTFPSGLSDPCEGVTATTAGALAQYCRSIPGIAQTIAQQGVFEYDDNTDRQSIEGFDGGNADLKQEKADTLTVGFVFRPSMLPGFSATIDYFDIEIEDAITNIPRQTIIDECTTSFGTSAVCPLLTREPANPVRPRTAGTVFQVDSLPVNAAKIETAGIDVAMRYRRDLGFMPGLADVGLAWTYLDKLTLQPLASLPVENNLGQLNGDGRLGAGFKNRANLSLGYEIGSLRVSWRMNYLSSIQDTLEENGPSLDPEFNDISSYLYHDLSARYSFGSDGQYEVYGGLDNVFDKKPPLIDQNGASNITGTETAADTYDPIGRYYYAGVVVKF
jgi:outer membrane receptor protein involved in Fe transport